MAEEVTTGEIYRRLEDMDDKSERRFDRLDTRLGVVERSVSALQERTSRPGTTGAVTGGATGLLALLGWEWLKTKLGGG